MHPRSRHPERPEIPVVADFLKNAAEQFGFVPDRPASDVDFKRAYAKAALAAGLTRDQIVGVYAFETGGNGSYDSQAGLVPYRPGARAISPADRLQPVAQHQYGVALCRRRQPLSSRPLRQKAKGADRPRAKLAWSARSRRSSA